MFDSCKFRMKEDLKRIEIIFDKLYSFLDNRELLRPIDIYLRDPLSNGYYIDFSSSNEVCLKNKHSKKGNTSHAKYAIISRTGFCPLTLTKQRRFGWL